MAATAKTETKHTAGPWRVEPEYGQPVILAGIDDVRRVAVIDTDHFSETEADGNAALIAAAPDLLDALTLLVRHCELGGYDGAPVDLARALLDRIVALKSAA